MTAKKPAKNDKVCALVSSGIDSLALLSHLSLNYAQIYPVYMQCGFRWEESELFWLKKFLRTGKLKNVEQLEILNLPMRDVYGSHWSVTGVKAPDAASRSSDLFLPGRHMLFLSKAAQWCALRKVELMATGVLKTCPFPDFNPSYFRRFENLVSEALEFEVRVIAPFADKAKEEIMFEAKTLGFEYSFSCINPKGYQHCGECFKCTERKKAFSRTGITDKTYYYRKFPEAVREAF